VNLHEELVLPQLDEWLSRKFDRSRSSSVREFEATQPDEPKPDEAAQREIAECDCDTVPSRDQSRQLNP
jgi:hypothetical protein